MLGRQSQNSDKYSELAAEGKRYSAFLRLVLRCS